MKTSNFKHVRFLVLAIFAAITMSLAAQTTVKGVVSDNTGEPIIGASVVEKGKSGGAVTDIDGNYTISVSNPNATLVFSYVGMKTKEEPLAGRTQLDVTLEENSEALSEVVVVGYGTQRKSDITGSVAQLSEDQMKQTIVTNADQMLQGK